MGSFLQTDRREIDCGVGNVSQADQSRTVEEGGFAPILQEMCLMLLSSRDMKVSVKEY